MRGKWFLNKIKRGDGEMQEEDYGLVDRQKERKNISVVTWGLHARGKVYQGCVYASLIQPSLEYEHSLLCLP